MTRGAGPRRTRRGGPFVFWVFLVAAIACAILTEPVTAQQEQILNLRQSEYDAARIANDGAVANWNVQQTKWFAAIDSISAAVASGNKDRQQRADRSAMTASVELNRLRSEVESTERLLAEKRRALKGALEARQDDLEVQRTSSTSRAQQQQLADQIQGLFEQIRRLEAPSPSALRPQLVYLPSLDLDDRDGRTEITGKIALLERRIRDGGQEVARVEQDIQQLKRRQDLQRRTGDVSAAQTRFDPDPPGARAGRPPEPAQGANTDAAGRPLTIDQQITDLNAYREELLLAQQQLRVRVANFKGRLTSMGGDPI